MEEAGISIYRLILAPLVGFAIGLAAGLLLAGDDQTSGPETVILPTSVPTTILVSPTAVVIVPTPLPTTPPASPTPATHVVQSGDTLSAIATQYDTTVEILLTLNDLASPNQLEIGQILTLP